MPEKIPSSLPPERKSDSERPTLPAPKNPFERLEQIPSVSAYSIPDPTKMTGEDWFSEDVDPDKNGVTISVEDGVGGYEGGEIASRAVAELAKEFGEKFRKINERRQNKQLKNPEDLSEERAVLETFVTDANLEVASQRIEHPKAKLMATTGLLARVVRLDDHWEVMGVSAGDSRAYLMHPDGRLEALSLDAHPILVMMRDAFGRDTAMRVQETLDNLESYAQFENFAKFSAQDKWPTHMPVNRDDIDIVAQLVGPKAVKEYFEGAERTKEDPLGRGLFHRSFIMSSFGAHVDPDYFQARVPAGGKVMLVSDGVEGLTRRELAAVLAADQGALVDRKLMDYALQGATPAERVARAASARGSDYAWSPRSKGNDDITAVVVEIPER
jgi:serine/threonine protein phosphatase PrpC